MAQTTIAHFAADLKMPAGALLEQLQKAGVTKSKADDLLSELDKSKLLDHLRRSHGESNSKKLPVGVKRILVKKILPIAEVVCDSPVEQASAQVENQPIPKMKLTAARVKGSLKEQLQHGVDLGLLAIRGQKTLVIKGGLTKAKNIVPATIQRQVQKSAMAHRPTHGVAPPIVSPRVGAGVPIPVMAPEPDRVPSLLINSPVTWGKPVPLNKEQMQRKTELEALEREDTIGMIDRHFDLKALLK